MDQDDDVGIKEEKTRAIVLGGKQKEQESLVGDGIGGMVCLVVLKLFPTLYAFPRRSELTFWTCVPGSVPLSLI